MILLWCSKSKTSTEPKHKCQHTSIKKNQLIIVYQFFSQVREELAYEKEGEGETGIVRLRHSRRSSLVNTPESSGTAGSSSPVCLQERREDREAIFKV